MAQERVPIDGLLAELESRLQLMTDDNYYEELGVEPGASRDEIRDAHQARVADLEAAREKKGVTDTQLQQNREEVARVRKAWNVLSDPVPARSLRPEDRGAAPRTRSSSSTTTTPSTSRSNEVAAHRLAQVHGAAAPEGCGGQGRTGQERQAIRPPDVAAPEPDARRSPGAAARREPPRVAWRCSSTSPSSSSSSSV